MAVCLSGADLFRLALCCTLARWKGACYHAAVRRQGSKGDLIFEMAVGFGSNFL